MANLQTTPILENVDCEVILVNNLVETQLKQLEGKPCGLLIKCFISEIGLILSGLIQNLVDIVVNRMGDLVDTVDKIT